MIIKKNNFQKKLAAQEEQKRIEEEAAKNKAEETAINPTNEDEYTDSEIFDIDNIDFTQRDERRTGNRRRGYRRIDDRNLISRAQEEATQIKEAAYQEGYNLGLEQAKSDVEKLKNALTIFMGADKRVFDAIAPDIIEISLEIAKKIIKHEVQTDPQIVIDTVMDIFKNIPKNEPKVVIKVNTIQSQYIKENLPDKLNLLGVESKISIISDDSISEGSCIVQTNNGIVDASLEAQLEIVQNALRSA